MTAPTTAPVALLVGCSGGIGTAIAEGLVAGATLIERLLPDRVFVQGMGARFAPKDEA